MGVVMGRIGRFASRWKYVVLGLLAAAVVGVFVAAMFFRPEPPASAVTYTAPPAPLELPLVSVIGDSYTAGTSRGGMGAMNWTKVAQADLSAAGVKYELMARGLGAAGYAVPGTAKMKFADVVSSTIGPATDVVVFVGSRNDLRATPEEVRGATAATYTAVKQSAPNAKLLVVGPIWVSENVPPTLVAIRDAVRSSAVDAGATFVDPIDEGWFFGPNSALIGDDNVHPTDAGHNYMAKLIEPHIKAALS
jgi:lysophospholipase L1-like esterase